MIRKFFVALAGGAIILFGIILIPTPAPEGWLIVFAGVTLLATEFTFAKRWLKSVKTLRVRLTGWIQRQPRIVHIGLNLLAIVIVVGILALGIWGVLRLL